MKKYFVPKEGFLTTFEDGFLGYLVDYGKKEAWAYYRGERADFREFKYKKKAEGERMKEISPAEAALLFGEI